MKTIPWLRTINDLAIDHDWSTPNHMKVATGLTYVQCLRLMNGEEPKWAQLEALAKATSMSVVEIAAYHELNKESLETELDAASGVSKGEEECQLSLPMSFETPGPSAG